MRPDILIIGQGIAGTMLGWELERAGISFAIIDQGHASAATSAAAGLINPITGRRLVKSGRIDELLPLARAVYQQCGHAHGMSVWRDLRVRRLFANERERAVFAHKEETGELSPFAGAGDEHGFWIEGGGRVDLRTLIGAAREHWRSGGRLRESVGDPKRELDRHEVVIDCTGVAAARGGQFSFVPWEFSKGEMLEVTAAGLEPDVVINCGHWVLPIAEQVAWVGATHEPGILDPVPTTAGRAILEASATRLIGAFHVVGQRAGIRINLPDKRPIAGRHPDAPRLGLINGLGAKGALWAPMLARQWVDHLTKSAPFDPEIATGRFVK